MPLFWTNACHLSSQKEIIVITENAGTACTSFGTRQVLFIQTKNKVFDLIRVPRGVGGVLRHCWEWSIDAVVEIGALDHAAEHPSTTRESAVVDALADALLQVWSPKID